MRKFNLVFYTFLFISCANNIESQNKDVFSIVNWNVQTFFDSNKDGNEYKEFTKANLWNQEKYEYRIKNLCDVIQNLNADIYVLEEIENQNILIDISNYINTNKWNSKDKWNYSCFNKSEFSCIGIAIISKYPLSQLKVHNFDIKTELSTPPIMRNLLEVTVNIGDKPITIFANHWKSKSGKKDKSDIWRTYQENLLASKINLVKNTNSNDYPILICGDFNKDIKEFSIENNIVTLDSGIFDKHNFVNVISPWFNVDGSFSTTYGSYYYNNEWERIDNFFVCGQLEILEFYPCTQEPFLTDEFIPNSYKINSGKGYSDHLPLYGLFKIK